MNKKHLFRLMGLSMLMAVGAMAMSASLAQAKWLILVNKTSVSSITLDVEVSKDQLLVPGLGLVIACKLGEGEVAATLSSESKVLSVNAAVTFRDCYDENFSEVCDVRGFWDITGSITAQGEGTGGMGFQASETYFVDLASEEFANIEYVGLECPLTEIDGRVSGKVRADLWPADSKTLTKEATLLDKGLTFGEEEAVLHNGSEAKTPVKALLNEASFNDWAISLVGL